MIKVQVTHFHPPNGRWTDEEYFAPDDCAAGYKAMQKCGARLTAEVLSTGKASVTIEEPELGDFDIRITPVGQQALNGIADMLRAFDTAKFEAWKKEME